MFCVFYAMIGTRETVTCLVVAGMCEIVNGNSYMLGSSRYV